MPRYDYDLITLGAGSGGVRASRLAGGYGAKVAVIEKSRPGGTCVMRGCVPKKLLVYGVNFAEEMENAAGFGWTIDEPHLNWGTLVQRKNAELDRLEGVYEGLLANNNVELIAGEGRIVDVHTVEVDGRRLTAEKILIATGGWPHFPKIAGIEHAISSNEALDLPELPKRAVVVGGGYIAVEFAGIFRAVGVDVTVVIRADQVLRGFDADVRSFLTEEMEKKGITIRNGVNVVSIAKQNGTLILNLDDQSRLETDLILYATGRKPNTRGIGLEDVGVSMNESGAVVVDSWNKSSVDNIFAIGDCTDRVNLTPVAIAEGAAFTETNFNNNPRQMDYANIPSAVFSHPPIGTVGLTEEQACRKGPVDVYISQFRPMKHTLSGSDEKMMMKLIVDRGTDRVVGCHMVGMDAPEILQGIGIALKCGATKAQFDSTIGIHPTAAEELVTMRTKREARA